MFDYFRSSYDLGEQFTNVVCQTKDIEEFGIGGTMTDYWLDPAGKLWCPHYRDTHTFGEILEDDERYDKRGFLNFEWIPTGVHGKYQPHLLSKYIEIHLANWKGPWEEWPRLRLHFKYGILQDYENITNAKAIQENSSTESRNGSELEQTDELYDKKTSLYPGVL